MLERNQTAAVKHFDDWIRGDFKHLNTELENIYFCQDVRSDVSAQPNKTKPLVDELVNKGKDHISQLLKEGNTDTGFDTGFDLLGNVGLYMAACRRHEITEPSREQRSPLKEASALSLQIGASLGVTPRFATSHLTTHNSAINGVYKSFTSLEDELTFIDYNSLGILSYMRCADALLKILPLGISHPIAANLFDVAIAALKDVIKFNEQLFTSLNEDRFFYCVRPYYKPHRVGLHIYRGANAGDFSGINVIDLLLGLCQGEDDYYSQLLVDKFLFMMPNDQAVLRDCMRRQSFMDAFLQVPKAEQANLWYQTNLKHFIELCNLHGQAAKQHHHQLVDKFISKMAENEPQQAQDKLTASGPPLPVLLRSLEKLKDLRAATPRDDIPSRYRDLEQLRASLK